MSDFQFGKVTRIGACCNNPVGCTMRPDGCLWKMHPWKRTHLDGDTTVRCQAQNTMPDPDHPDPYTAPRPNVFQCKLMSAHSGGHETEFVGRFGPGGRLVQPDA